MYPSSSSSIVPLRKCVPIETFWMSPRALAEVSVNHLYSSVVKRKKLKEKLKKALLISREHCELHENYKKYKRDPNNMLALSHTMRGYFDALDRDLDVVGVETERVVNGRWKL